MSEVSTPVPDAPKNPDTPKKWGTVSDLARALGCSDRHVRRLRKDGRIVVDMYGRVDIQGSIRLVAYTQNPARTSKLAPGVAAPPVAAPSCATPPPALRANPEGPGHMIELMPCMLRRGGCGHQQSGGGHCGGWEARELVEAGFAMGWHAHEARDGSDADLRDLLANGDPDCRIAELLTPAIHKALIASYEVQFAATPPGEFAGALDAGDEAELPILDLVSQPDSDHGDLEG